jgi:hypothetical protein
MVVDLVFQVVFDQPRHDDDGLAHVKGKDAFEQGHGQDDAGIQAHVAGKNVVNGGLLVQTCVQVMQGDAFIDQVESVAHHLGRDNGENIGDGNKQDPEQKAVFVFEKVFVEVT